MEEQGGAPDRGVPEEGLGFEEGKGGRGGRTLLKRLLIALGVVSAPPVLWFLLLPWPLHLRWQDPGETSFMAFRRGEALERGDTLAIQRSSVPLEEISPVLRRAVLAAEDDRFYQHGGIDWRALAEEVEWEGDTLFSWLSLRDLRALGSALGHYREHRAEIRGRSTLTQQLAKNLYFTPERSLLRKVSEALVAKRLEWFLPKDRILELYLNVVELGPGIFGVEAASQLYFGHSARELSLREAATLAATLPHPLSSNPLHRPARMAWRRDYLLQRLGLGLPVEPPPVDVPVLLPDSGGSDSISGRGGG